METNDGILGIGTFDPFDVSPLARPFRPLKIADYGEHGRTDKTTASCPSSALVRVRFPFVFAVRLHSPSSAMFYRAKCPG